VRWNEVLDWLVRAGFGTLLVTVVAYFLKERRQTLASGRVAERTVDASVMAADAGALEAHVLAIEKAFAIERTSSARAIRGLKEELRDVEGRCEKRVQVLTTELAQKEATISALRSEVATLTTAVRRLEGSQP
jgi:hypothetical protein